MEFSFVLLAAFVTLVGIMCAYAFIVFVMFSKTEKQTRQEARIAWLLCPFRTLHGVSFDSNHERWQTLYLLGLVFLWPFLLPLIPVGIRNFQKEDGA